MPNGGWNPRIWILLKASPEKSLQDSASIQYNQPQKLRFCIDLLSQNEPKPHRKNPKMLILLKASFKKRHPMDVGSINWNPKVCISLRASSGKKSTHIDAPPILGFRLKNSWHSLLITAQNPRKESVQCILARGVVGLYEYIVNRISCQDTHHARQHIYNTFNTQYHEINHAMQTDTNNNMDATAHVLMWSSTRNLMRMPCRRTAMPSLLYARVVQKRNKL